MRVELVLDRCLFCLEAFFHFKAEEAVLHSPRPQEVQSFILLVACCTAEDILQGLLLALGYSVLSMVDPVQLGFILQAKKLPIFFSFISPFFA